MVTALLMMHPELLAGAILFRPLPWFDDDSPVRLGATPVLILDGDQDDCRSSGDGYRLAQRLCHAGARVAHHVLPVRHSITDMDRQIARKWLQKISVETPDMRKTYTDHTQLDAIP